MTYVSGLFQGSQLKWTTLTKETYAIYMAVKVVMLRSDHLPIMRFLRKQH